MTGRLVHAVSGSIAAFKGAALCSEMVKAGLDVRVVMTRDATRFVAPLTFEALTGYPVAIEVWDEQPGGSRMGHLELARWADALLVAPASAGAMGRLALGAVDDMLGCVALSTRAPLIVAPAMETGMFEHPATQEHLHTLRARGATIVGPATGRLASGAQGAGRMEEPETILAVLRETLGTRRDLETRRVLVSAGPTYEPIDRVRFIGNRSSGKMGYAIAEEAASRGADTVLVSGPTALLDPTGVRTIRVETAAEMRGVVLREVRSRDIVVMAAAVADFRPHDVAPGKLRRSEGMTLRLEPTQDIAAEAAAANPEALHVGFALETGDLAVAAREKMSRKGQSMVVANAISDEHNPFGSETNRVVIVTRDRQIDLPLMSKRELARRIWDEILRIVPT